MNLISTEWYHEIVPIAMGSFRLNAILAGVTKLLLREPQCSIPKMLHTWHLLGPLLPDVFVAAINETSVPWRSIYDEENSYFEDKSTGWHERTGTFSKKSDEASGIVRWSDPLALLEFC